MTRRLWATALGFLAVTVWCVAAAAQTTFPPGSFQTQVVTVSIGTPRAPSWVNYLLVTPTTRTSQVAILFAGGDGVLGLTYDGMITTGLKQNFLVRSRELIASKGFITAVVDAPQGAALDGNIRLSAEYAELMSAVIKDVRNRTNATHVWLVGTSTGSLSATSIAARYPQKVGVLVQPDPARPNGIALPSAQSATVQNFCGKTVFNATLSAINVPSYLAGHQDDKCGCSPAAKMPDVITALSGTKKKTAETFTGGLPPQSAACDALSPHGFYGIEDQVVTSMTNWMKKTSN